MRKYIVVMAVSCCLFLTGCGAKSGYQSFDYLPPDLSVVKNKKTVNQSVDEAWSSLLSKLSTSFFVINNIDSQSHFINISLKNNRPEKYIDCGVAKRTTGRDRGDKRMYTYPIAQSSNYTLELDGYGFFEDILNVNRRCSLDSQINIYLAPITKKQTLYTVTVSYVLKKQIDTEFKQVNVDDERLVNRRRTKAFHEIDAFATNETYTRQVQEEGFSGVIMCGANGKLEKELLDLLL